MFVIVVLLIIVLVHQYSIVVLVKLPKNLHFVFLKKKLFPLFSGIGRSGTFVLVDSILKMVNK
jgi:protein tyrosine phosphatase